MSRSILGVIVGYVAVAIFVMTTFTLFYVVLGPDQVFRPGSYEPSGLWILISFVLGFAGAVIGGLACAVVARRPKPPKVLAGLVLGLGLVVAVPTLMSDDTAPVVREPGVNDFAAMKGDGQPGWVALLTPFVGAAGVLLGARLRRAGGHEKRAPR